MELLIPRPTYIPKSSMLPNNFSRCLVGDHIFHHSIDELCGECVINMSLTLQASYTNIDDTSDVVKAASSSPSY